MALLILSCNSKESAEEKTAREESEAKEKDEIKKKEKQNKIDELTRKYNVKYKLDTVRLRYSIEYQPILESGHLLLEIKQLNINDIFKIDSLYYVSIDPKGTISELILPITEEQIKLLSDKNLFHFLIVDINHIKKIKFVFRGELEGEDVSVNLENSTGFSANGKLIEMVSVKRE
jgi:hypothetical protein